MELTVSSNGVASNHCMAQKKIKNAQVHLDLTTTSPWCPGLVAMLVTVKLRVCPVCTVVRIVILLSSPSLHWWCESSSLSHLSLPFPMPDTNLWGAPFLLALVASHLPHSCISFLSACSPILYLEIFCAVASLTHMHMPQGLREGRKLGCSLVTLLS